MTDPVSEFEHSHDRLTSLAMELRRSVAASHDAAFKSWDTLVEQVHSLREELLLHFAKEEEGLFPFVRAHIPAKIDAVNRMERAHDTICGTVVRLGYLLKRPPIDPDATLPQLHSLHERFERAYADHSREEKELFSELGTSLDSHKRAALIELLLGL